MFKRNEFESLMRTAERHIDQSAGDPAQLREALIAIMGAMSQLADSCENDMKDQLKKLAQESNTGVER